MAKPKGSTLSALFEVSEQERQAFYERIQRKIHPIDEGAAQQIIREQPKEGTAAKAGIPDTGTPEIGTPEIGTPESGISDFDISNAEVLPAPPPSASTELNQDSAASIIGTPKRGIPESGTPFPGSPESGIQIKRLRIRRALQVQDGHSLGEHLVLTTLWNEAESVEGQSSYRRITIGYRTLSGICRLTVNNCKANLRSLIAKMAIDAESGYSSTAATTYRVYSFAEILKRREAAGLTHVLRSRGSTFVDPETGIPVSGTPPVSVTGIPVSEKGTPGSGERGVPVSGTQLRSKKEDEKQKTDSSLVLGIVSKAIRQYLTIDDDGVRRIIAACLQKDAESTADEIGHFAAVSSAKIARQRNVDNPIGLLINQVPRFFPGAELESYRARKAQQLAEGRETARKILSGPGRDRAGAGMGEHRYIGGTKSSVRFQSPTSKAAFSRNRDPSRIYFRNMPVDLCPV